MNGALLPDVEARLLPVSGYNVEAGYGELLVKTPSMAKGYLDAGDRILDDQGWYHTKDIVFLAPGACGCWWWHFAWCVCVCLRVRARVCVFPCVHVRVCCC